MITCRIFKHKNGSYYAEEYKKIFGIKYWKNINYYSDTLQDSNGFKTMDKCEKYVNEYRTQKENNILEKIRLKKDSGVKKIFSDDVQTRKVLMEKIKRK
jgi:hypothetical protein